MKRYLNPDVSKWKTISRRPSFDFKEIEPIVLEVFEAIKNEGDSAVLNYTSTFDKVSLKSIKVLDIEIDNAIEKVSHELKNSILLAKENIEKFHSAQATKPIYVDTVEGVSCWQEKRPIEKVGIYIPGGTAVLFSSILMLAIPAKIAKCDQVILCTPPNKDGTISPAVAYAAKICGITQIFRVGGIQAIASMTFGTESIPKVYKIFGPGNQYVTVAKQIASLNHVAIDLPAGPSELLIVADSSAKPEFVASDLLSQAEHGIDSQVILVTTYEPLMDQVEKEILKQLNELPRKSIVTKSMKNSKMILFNEDVDAISFINEYGPEHYIICVSNEDIYLKSVKNAGSVFVGNYTPESAGDYASGTNHTLPTNGYAKQYSGVNLDSFLKSITFQKITKAGIRRIGPSIEIMANEEGLQAHKNAVSLRLKDLS